MGKQDGYKELGLIHVDPVMFRRHLIASNKEDAIKGYLMAIERGIADPVILVIDIRDEVGGAIGRRCDPGSCADIMRRYEHGEGIPVLTCATSREGAVEAVRDSTPGVAEGLAGMPPESGRIPFVCIAMGGTYAGVLIMA